MYRTLGWIVMLAALLTVACRGGGSGVDETPVAPGRGSIVILRGQPVEIGVSTALSGEQVVLGVDLADAAELAAADFARDIKGHSISIVRKDDHCTDAEVAVAVAREFIASSSLAGVIGPMCTIGAQAANAIYAAAGVVHVAATVTRTELSRDDGYFFRTAWRDDAQARVQARYARETLLASTAVIIDDSEPYGTGLAEQFARAFAEAGGEVLLRDRVAAGTQDFSGLVRQIKSADPAVVVYEGLNPEGALLVRELRLEGYTGAFIGPDGLLSSQDFISTAQQHAEGAVLTGGATPDQPFGERFQARFGRLPGTPFVLQSYDGVMLLLGAIESVARENAAGDLEIDRQALADALRAREAIGTTGDVRFDEQGDRLGDTPRAVGLAIYRVTQGRFERVD